MVKGMGLNVRGRGPLGRLYRDESQRHSAQLHNEFPLCFELEAADQWVGAYVPLGRCVAAWRRPIKLTALSRRLNQPPTAIGWACVSVGASICTAISRPTLTIKICREQLFICMPEVMEYGRSVGLSGQKVRHGASHDTFGYGQPRRPVPKSALHWLSSPHMTIGLPPRHRDILSTVCCACPVRWLG